MTARELTVLLLPRRVAHATHALLVATREHPPMPRTAAEICVYDSEALTPRHTAAALREARQWGLSMYAAPYWVATNEAQEMRRQLEERFLEDTEDD